MINREITFRPFVTLADPQQIAKLARRQARARRKLGTTWALHPANQVTRKEGGK